MPRGFYLIMAAQFFSSLADNALLVAAIALLIQMQTPEWMTPLLKFFFTISYVLFAAFVGAFADSMPKGRVMFITNMVKIVGCAAMFFHELLTVPGIQGYLVVLIAYSIVGLGAAAYSPAKYGILTEYLPHHKLVIANGWIEGLTVTSIILGTLLGGVLISRTVSSALLNFDMPVIDTGVDSPPEAAIAVIMGLYLIAGIFNLYLPDTGVDHRAPSRNPFYLVREFAHCMMLLWRDKLGQISLATTTLFWGAGATLQFIVLKWAEVALGYTLSQATVLQGVCAIGHCSRGSARRALRAAQPRCGCRARRHRHGLDRHRHELRDDYFRRSAADDPDRRARRFLRGADERDPAAPRSHPDGRRPFDRRAELQREPVDTGDAQRLRAADVARFLDLHGGRDFWSFRGAHHGRDPAALPSQPAQRFTAADTRPKRITDLCSAGMS